VASYGWERITVGGAEHEHSFRKAGAEVRTAAVTVDGDEAHVLAGLSDLVVLKTTGSEFWGFPRDRYTTLAETRDRILATAVTARWRYAHPDHDVDAIDFDATFAGVRNVLLETFAATHSLALQQSLYAMGRAVLEHFPVIAEIRMSMPNKHHFVQDLSAFGLDNPDVVYHADDRPYGLIEGTVQRDDAAPAPAAWEATPGFC
jgi:urate oxidase